MNKTYFKIVKYEDDEILVFKPNKTLSDGANLLLERMFPKPYKDEMLLVNSIRKKHNHHLIQSRVNSIIKTMK